MADCLIALGANLGNCPQNLRAALASLASLTDCTLVARSQWHATPPIGGPPRQEEFLNGAAQLRTSLSPAALLGQLHAIETAAKRTRDEHWAARTLDLDLLLYDEQTIHTPSLVVPHPRMSYRRFVLAPAVEIAAEMVHPTSGWTLAALLRHLEACAACVAIGADEPQLAELLRSELTMRFPDTMFTSYNTDAKRARLVVWIGEEVSPEIFPSQELLAGPTAVLCAPSDEVKWENVVAEAAAAVEAAGAANCGTAGRQS